MGVRRWLLVPALVALLVPAGGCADGGSPPAGASGPAASPSTGSSGKIAPPGDAVSPKPPSVAGGPSPTPVELTGTTVVGVESGCTLLIGGGTTHLLVGLPEPVEPGAQLRVLGAPDPELATTCQEGTPFLVAEVLTP